MREPNYNCNTCGAEGYKYPFELKRSKNYFCSLECYHIFSDKRVEVICDVCQKLFLKEQCEIKRSKKNCCSIECSKLLQKYHKDWGSNRSKLEIAIEEYLSEMFSFEIIYNKRKIGYELDIHIPHLNQAIEINGPTHYRNIYGIEHLERTQRVDKEKLEECKKRNINLIVINVSEDKSTKVVQAQRIQEVVKIIKDRIEELDRKTETSQLVLEI